MDRQSRLIRRIVPSLIVVFAVGLTACPDSEEPDDPDGEAQTDTDDEEPPDTMPPDTTPPQDEGCEAAELPSFELEPFAGGHTFDDALHITQTPGDDESYYVVQRKGRILLVRDGEVRDEPFLDIRDRVVSGYGEQGLLGLAFHPNYEENGRFFVSYVLNGDNEWRNVVAEYHRSDDNEFRANPEEVQRLVDIRDPRKQHNGGTLQFGPDGYLYASLGNGGAKQKRKHGGIGRAQYTKSLFGTLMRMDVDRPDANFAVEENPFADSDEGDSRILAWGLRNAWRFTVDHETGDIFIADVGKRSREEIDFISSDSDGGQNFGWPAYQGTKEGPVDTAKKAVDEHTTPIVENQYQSTDAKLRDACAFIGGQVYRGESIPAAQGYYIYGDLCSGDLGALRYCDTDDSDAEPQIVDHQRLSNPEIPGSLRGIVSDNAGDLYLVNKQQINKLVAVE